MSSLVTGALTPAQASGQRVVRVFVSSTFRDMQAERDELTKRVFPQLRKFCESRAVTWGEVDLRWGITDEQTSEGKVLPICLAEIQRCQPYFIGLLGERYGWIPLEIPGELVNREPWLAEHRSHSVTELEIHHGVLNNPDMADHAFFYFRDPSFIERLPEREQETMREGPVPEEIESFGLAEAERRAQDRMRKLDTLKQRVRESDFPVRENYRDPKELGELVLQDLTQVIDRLYPEDSQPHPLDREAAEHEAFAASRTGVYIGREAYFERLDAHARDRGPPLVVLGESGMGKSALLANWAARWRATQPDDLLLMHFIGATQGSAEWVSMLRRIMGEFQRRFAIEEEIPEDPDGVRAAFAGWLQMAATRGRVVLILDALNKLEDRDKALELVWLPAQIPEAVRMILSTLPGPPLDEISKRDWPTLLVEPLEQSKRTRLIEKYLEQYTKALSPARVNRIAAAPQSANPLYLRALLEELRLFGVHEELDSRIDHYLGATEVDDLYERILKRYEQDYEEDRPRLVEHTMTLIRAARRGLSEAELLDLLEPGEGPLPRAHWSPLYLAAEASLVNRSGLITFAHDYLAKAVDDRYFKSDDLRRRAHRRIAAYFAAQSLYLVLDDGAHASSMPRANLRKLDEQAWQLFKAEDYESLKRTVADIRFISALVAELNRADEVIGYWRTLADSYSIRETYRDSVSKFKSDEADPEERAMGLNNVARLHLALGYRDEAADLLADAMGELESADSYMSVATAVSYMNLGVLRAETGRFEEAEQALLSAIMVDESIARVGLPLARARNNLAKLYLRWGKLDEAEKACEAALGVLENGDRASGSVLPGIPNASDDSFAVRGLSATRNLELATALFNRACIYARRGDFPAAIGVGERAVAIFRTRPGIPPTEGASYLYELASAYHGAGDLQGCERALADADELLRQAGDTSHRVLVLNALAELYASKRDYELALQFARAALEQAQQTDDTASVARQEGTLSAVFQAMDDLSLAEAHAQRALEAVTLTDTPSASIAAMVRLGEIFHKQGRGEDAYRVFERAFAVQESLQPDQAAELGQSALRLGNICDELAQPKDALGWYERAIAIKERHLDRDDPSWDTTLNNYALTLNELGRDAESLPVHERVLALRRATLDQPHEYVGRTLAFLGMSHFKTGNVAQALSCFEEALDIFTRTLGEDHPKTVEMGQSIMVLRMLPSDPGRERGSVI